MLYAHLQRLARHGVREGERWAAGRKEETQRGQGRNAAASEGVVVVWNILRWSRWGILTKPKGHIWLGQQRKEKLGLQAGA